MESTGGDSADEPIDTDVRPRNPPNAEEDTPFIDREPLGEEQSSRAPRDLSNLVYLIFLLHGIGVLLPWNTFLTIGKDVSKIHDYCFLIGYMI